MERQKDSLKVSPFNTYLRKMEIQGAVHQLFSTPGSIEADEVDLLSENVHTTNKNVEPILLLVKMLV